MATWQSELFTYPVSLALDPDGNVYVADGSRVLVFDTNGALLWNFGTYGTGDGQFGGYIFGIDLDSSGNIYVVDNNYDANVFRVEKFDSQGQYVAQWGAEGTANGQFTYPSGIAIDSNDNIYVADSTCRVQKFNTEGVYQSQFGTCGTGDGQFDGQDYWSMDIDAENNLYIADAANNRIQKFDSNGTYLEQWGTEGSGNGQFSMPDGVAIDASGNIYVADRFNDRIQKFGLPQNLGTVSIGDGTVASYLTLASTNNITSITSDATTTYDKTYPLGLVSFTFRPATVGATETVQIFFETSYGAAEVTAYKYNATTQTSTAISGATITAATQNSKTGLLVTYDVTDGGALDADGVANGSITDPVGLVAVATTNGGGTNGGNNNGTGNGGGTDVNGGDDTEGGDAQEISGLADTGTSVVVYSIAAGLLLIGGSVAAYRVYRKTKVS